jgi:hypothetical protein
VSDFSPYKQTCTCGHDISSHFRHPDTGKREGCLGLGECGCKGYHDQFAPKLPPTLPPPPDTLRVAAPKVLAVGVRVRVTDCFSPHYMLEGSVVDIWLDSSGNIHGHVETDDYGRHWFPSGSMQIL